MSPESPKTKKRPELTASAGAVPCDSKLPERVRKPHYDWEHEGPSEAERPRVKTAASRISEWKENAEAWIKSYLLLADSSFGDRNDDFNAA